MKYILILLIIVSGCDLRKNIQNSQAAKHIRKLERKGYLKDSSSIKFVKGKDSLILDTTYLQSILRDSIHTDSIIYIREIRTNVREVLKHRVDTIYNNNTTIVKDTKICKEPSWWYNFIEHWAIGVFSCMVFVFALKKFT